MPNKKYMKISELSKISGVSIPKIKYYIANDIISQPIKINKTMALYNHQHLEQLNMIRDFREKKLPLAAIRRSLSRVAGNQITKEREEIHPSQVLRNQVIDLCIELFRKKGYEKVTITDITETAGIARNTFYKVFKDKKELFTSSLTKLFFEWRREAPDDKASIPLFMKKQMLAHYEVYPRWSDMMNIFRSAATRYPDEFADKLEEALKLRIGAMMSDIELGMRQGVIRKLNAELAAIILAGQIDYIGYFMTRGEFGDTDSSIIVDQMLDILFNGIGGANFSSSKKGLLKPH